MPPKPPAPQAPCSPALQCLQVHCAGPTLACLCTSTCEKGGLVGSHLVFCRPLPKASCLVLQRFHQAQGTAAGHQSTIKAT